MEVSLCSEKGEILSKEKGGIIKAYGNIIIGGASYIAYDEDNSDFDAYEAKSRNEEVPSSVKAKSGGSTYSNFDIDDNIMYKYTPNDTEKIPFIVKRDAGRIFGGDFKFEFSSSDDESSDINSNLMDKLRVGALSSRGQGQDRFHVFSLMFKDSLSPSSHL